ncbi:unnamed protein product [marine sediment metagenome]|uniref:DUF4190 domain-containing protein n=1 Tax=marine sediment metagenome TaxID=412755 RepID=X0T630_9ZZZZ
MKSKLAITALVFSIAACLVPFIGALFSITSIILAIIALVKINKNKELEGQGIAIAALIISTVGVAIVWTILSLILTTTGIFMRLFAAPAIG